jgi:AraC-like DNA-binding protein
MSRRTKLLERVFAYIDDNFRDPIGLGDVATAVGHGPAYLTGLVSDATGRPVHKWIAERRLAEARRLLVETDVPIHGVASAAGFRDPAYFSRAFVRSAGQSPSRWRRGSLRPATGDALGGAAAMAVHEHVATAEAAITGARSRAERDAILLAAAAAIVPLRVTVNRRDPSSGAWYHYGATAIAFTDADATVPLLLHGCTAAELHLERSSFDFYRRLAHVREIAGFFKLPLFVGGVCLGALCAIVSDPAEINREHRFALESLARAYERASTRSSPA